MAIILIRFYNLNFVLAIAAGALAASALGGAFGATTIRLKPGYQGIALLLVSEAFYWLMVVVSGEEGYSVFQGGSALAVPTYIAGIFIFGLSMIALHMLESSGYRVKLLAVRGDNLAAEAGGINVALQKLLAFVISSFFAGLGGAFFSTVNLHADYSIFGLPYSFLPIGMVAIGGMGIVAGSIVGATVVTFVLNLLPVWTSIPLTNIVYGAAVILILRFKPTGLIGILSRKKS